MQSDKPPPAPTAQTTADPPPGSVQRAGVLARLRQRRVTARTWVVYIAAVALVVFADPVPATFIAGALIVIAGLALRIWTFGHLCKNQTLATTGPYAYTRNPAYLGSATIMVGLFLAAGNPDTMIGRALWIAGVVGLAVFFRQYLPRKYAREYARLACLFPDAVARHAAHVPDFLPRATPWRSGDRRRFSWARVMANHEPVWPLACFAALAAMWFL